MISYFDSKNHFDDVAQKDMSVVHVLYNDTNLIKSPYPSAGLEKSAPTNENRKMLQRLYFLFAILFASFAAAGEPTVLPLGKLESGDLSAVLPSEKAMIILAVAFQIIWKLVGYIYKLKTKSLDLTEEKLDRCIKMVHDLQVDVKSLKAAPNEDQMFIRLQPAIKLAALEAIQKYGREKL